MGSLLRRLYLLYFSQPAADRLLYKLVRGRPVHSIVEVGIGLTGRTPRLFEAAAWRKHDRPLRYTGIDLFEARPSGWPGLSLKQAFTALKRPNVQVQLVPGDPATALRRVANSLAGTDLLLISADHDPESLARAWIWLPRILTPTSLILQQEPAQNSGPIAWKRLTLADVQRLATEAGKMRRAA